MHIPDGYLGPHTYIAFWIIMIPIWLLCRTEADHRAQVQTGTNASTGSCILICNNDVQYNLFLEAAPAMPSEVELSPYSLIHGQQL